MADKTPLRATLAGFGHMYPQVNWHIDAHVHDDYYQMITVLSGTVEIEVNGQHFLGKRGDWLLYPQGEWHAAKSAGKKPLEMFLMDWLWQGTAPTLHCPLRISDHGGRMQTLVYWIHELFPATSAHESAMIDDLFNAILFEFERAGQAQEHAMVQRVKSFMQHHLPEPLSLEILARDASMSKFHFSREFKKITGVPPMKFLRRMRVEAARSLLLSTSWPLKTIALQVGFADEFHLSHVFRRVTGVSPKQVRKNTTYR